MKLKTYSIWTGIAIFLAAVCAGCEQAEDGPEGVHKVSPVLSFHYQTDTKGVVNDFAIGSRVGVYLTRTESFDPYQGDQRNMNVSYKLQGPDFWEAAYASSLGSEDANAWGYYPYQSGADDGLITLKNGEDFMYSASPGLVTRSSPAVDISLKHVMALVKFSISASVGKVRRISIANLPESATLDIRTGAIVCGSNTVSLNVDADSSDMTGGIPVIPGNEITLIVDTDKQAYLARSGCVLQSGRQYVFSIGK